MNAAPKDSWTRAMRGSAYTFLEEAFKSEEFSSSRPPLIKRNWVLHGHDSPAQWTQADALRLFAAVRAVAELGVGSFKPLPPGQKPTR